MFGIGLPELAVLAFIGVIVFGPDKLPELARQSAHLVRRAKQMADGARDQLRSELGPEYADFEIRDLDPRSMVRRHLTAAFDTEDDEEGDGEPDSDDADASASPADDTTTGPADLDSLWDASSAPSLLRRSRHRVHQPAPHARSRRTTLTRK